MHPRFESQHSMNQSRIEEAEGKDDDEIFRKGLILSINIKLYRCETGLVFFFLLRLGKLRS